MKRKRRVAIDGEGAGRDPHRYTLLANSDGDYIEARDLSTEQCLKALLDWGDGATLFGFYLGYDWTMILRDLPNEALYRLLRPELRAIPKGEGGGFTWVRYNPGGKRVYQLHYLAGMMQIRSGGRRVTVWDVGKFYQCTFGKALDVWGIGTLAEREFIGKMKAERSEFNELRRAEIRRYCQLECSLLNEAVDALIAAHEDIDLRLRQFHGPGSSASVALRKMGIADIRGVQPDEVVAAAQTAFFGGRFEHRCSGKVDGPIHPFDIISAYPSETQNLPCLEHARWKHTTKSQHAALGKHALIKYALEQSDDVHAWGPLPCRLGNGEIVFPSYGSIGWCWRDEFNAAVAHWSSVRFLEAWVLHSDCDCRPFARVREWYDERARVGRKSGPGLALKLVINSIYGKLAQCVGLPAFASRIWAGMITSGTRAKLLRALALDESAVLSVATDGLLSLARLPLNTADALGGWELSPTHSYAVLARPGILWTDAEVKSRGLPRASLHAARETIEQALLQKLPKVELAPVTDFGGAKACVYLTPSGEIRRRDEFGEWFERPRSVSLLPQPKRADGFALWKFSEPVESRPYRFTLLSETAKKLKKTAENNWASR